MKAIIRKLLNEAIAISKEVQISNEDREFLRNISWEDLIIDQVNEESPIQLSIDTPPLPSGVNIQSGLAVSIQVIADTLYQLHINIANSLQGLGLGYKIMKAIVYTYGHFYAGKGRMQNDLEIPKMHSKLTHEPDFTTKYSDLGFICVLNDNPDKEYLLDFIG
jgi:hypothetical protein